RFTKLAIKKKTIHGKKCSIMMEIIPNKPIRDRSLRAHRFYGRMVAECRHGTVKTGARSTRYAIPPVIIFDILYQPVLRIISVAGLIRLFSFFVFIKGPDIYKLTFTHKSSPDVLGYKNILLPDVFYSIPVP